jgi:hypothetical protein
MEHNIPPEIQSLFLCIYLLNFTVLLGKCFSLILINFSINELYYCSESEVRSWLNSFSQLMVESSFINPSLAAFELSVMFTYRACFIFLGNMFMLENSPKWSEMALYRIPEFGRVFGLYL